MKDLRIKPNARLVWCCFIHMYNTLFWWSSVTALPLCLSAAWWMEKILMTIILINLDASCSKMGLWSTDCHSPSTFSTAASKFSILGWNARHNHCTCISSSSVHTVRLWVGAGLSTIVYDTNSSTHLWDMCIRMDSHKVITGYQVMYRTIIQCVRVFISKSVSLPFSD